MQSAENASATEWLTKKDVCKLLQISTRSVDLFRAEHGLPSCKLGNVVRFERSEVESWFRRFRQSGKEAG